MQKMEEEKKRLSGRKLRLYEDYRSGRMTKEQYVEAYKNNAVRILDIDKSIPELRENAAQVSERIRRAENQEKDLKEMAGLDVFDKEKLKTVIDSVKVYGADRIEITWKTDNPFISEMNGEKEVLEI